MSNDKPRTGQIGWVDLTVPDAAKIRDFYAQVVGWHSEDIDMGGYSDFVMQAPGGHEAVAGICHARGLNAAIHLSGSCTSSCPISTRASPAARRSAARWWSR